MCAQTNYVGLDSTLIGKTGWDGLRSSKLQRLGTLKLWKFSFTMALIPISGEKMVCR